MEFARTALRASTGILQDKRLRHPVRPVARASTWWKSEDLVKHPARPASRASTEWEQEGRSKHHARPVPRTRTRLLRVVLQPHAGVMWAIRGLTEAHAQRAWQESTRHQQDRPIARTAGQGRILQQ